MGTYRVWIATGTESQSASSKEARSRALEIAEPYDEANNIPGDWPGLSFDYYQEEIPVHTAGFLLEDADEADLPYAIITPTAGQLIIDCETAESQWDALNGALPNPSELVAVMRWHS